jgi:HD-like signal output (HDOD) protein
LAADPALTAKVLRLANSAYFHVSRTIGTVDDALRMLGFVMVRNLVLGNGMVAAFRDTPGMSLARFWRFNLYTACASRWLAMAAGANSDLAFTVGLIQGIGQLQMHAAAPAAMRTIDSQMDVLDAGRAGLETQMFGFHHGEVAAELATIWHFPAPIVEALRHMPVPLAAHEFSETAGWVHLGAWRARCELLALNDGAMTDSYPRDVGRRLGIAPTWVPALAAASAATPSDAAPMPPLDLLTGGLEALFN